MTKPQLDDITYSRILQVDTASPIGTSIVVEFSFHHKYTILTLQFHEIFASKGLQGCLHATMLFSSRKWSQLSIEFILMCVGAWRLALYYFEMSQRLVVCYVIEFYHLNLPYSLMRNQCQLNEKPYLTFVYCQALIPTLHA